MDKIKCAQEFLKSLEQPSVTMNMMSERMDMQMLKVIKSYSILISRIKDKLSMEEKDIITCSMIIGYLLKGHLDRIELEEKFKM